MSFALDCAHAGLFTEEEQLLLDAPPTDPMVFYYLVWIRQQRGDAATADAAGAVDDAFTRAVIQKSLPRLKVISKYGIGLDKIDLKAATDLKVPVLFTPGVNHTTVAEHTFALLLAVVRNLVVEANHVPAGNWTRITGNELCVKTLLLVGLGRLSK